VGCLFWECLAPRVLPDVKHQGKKEISFFLVILVEYPVGTQWVSWETKKTIKKEEFLFKYFTMQKFNLQKNPLKETKSFKIS
jgi:hypothetical protein